MICGIILLMIWNSYNGIEVGWLWEYVVILMIVYRLGFINDC